MKQITYELPQRCAIGSITLRETNGVDEEQAAVEAESHGISVNHCMVEAAIVMIDGEPATPGATGYRRWPTKTRSVVATFNERLNGVEEQDLIPLIEEAEGEGADIVDGENRTRYRMPDGFDLKFVVLREMMEADERAAAAAGKSAEDLKGEMIRRCIVETDRGMGMSAEDLKMLSTRTRKVLSTYWSGMNFVPDEEILPLAMAAEAVAREEETSVANSGEHSSASGSGSPVPADAA